MIKRVLSILAIAAISSGVSHIEPATAQEMPREANASDDGAAMEACFAAAETDHQTEESCIGTLVSACVSSAVTTVEMLDCYAPEFEFWESRLNVTYAALREAYRLQDEDDEPVRALAPRLENVQAEWQQWRDAKCGFEYDKFRGGSLGRVVALDCRLQETAERVLELEDLLEEANF